VNCYKVKEEEEEEEEQEDSEIAYIINIKSLGIINTVI